MLALWAVYAIAAGLKFWRLTALFRRHLPGIPTKTKNQEVTGDGLAEGSTGSVMEHLN